MCFDTSMTVSVEQALGNWRDWSDGKVEWREHLDLSFIDGQVPRLRVSRKVALAHCGWSSINNRLLR